MGKKFTIPKGILKNLVEEIPEALYAREDETRAFAVFRLLAKAYKIGFAEGQKDGANSVILDRLPAVGGYH